MIASLTGTVAHIGVDHVVVEVGGLGLRALVTARTASTLRTGQAARLATSLVVREDALTLFGFADDDERVLFELLQGATGVGPKLALAVLATYAPTDVRKAIALDDVKALTKVSGIGVKGAQRLIVELKDKVGTVVGSSVVTLPPVPRADTGWRAMVGQALEGWGFGAREVAEGLDAAAATAPGDEPDVAALLKTALAALRRPT